jgi:SAM-dependent methyltransferase
MLSLLRRAVRAFRNRYSSPEDYWNRRYRRQGAAYTGPGCIDIGEQRNRVDYDEKWSHLRNVLDAHGVEHGARVLDAGCGNGAITQFLVERGCVVTAADFSEAALMAASTRGLAGVTWIRSPLHEIPLSQRFDAVLCIDVIHHIVDEAQFRSTIDRNCQLTNDGGICILQTHFLDDTELAREAFGSSSHVRWRSRDDVRAALPDGFDVLDSESYLLPEEDATKELWVIGRSRTTRAAARE